jgi:hypothetical protein
VTMGRTLRAEQPTEQPTPFCHHCANDPGTRPTPDDS